MIMKKYYEPTILNEIILEMDDAVLAGVNSVNKKSMAIEHESAGNVNNQSDWNLDWTEE